ncbi:MAG: selenide, water dikinase SelD [Rhodobacteraceae bacterium]|nr:selenide, water dikinase SelD [Paracoccaceae bacterium]
MHEDPFPLVQDIVLIGGGHAHALVLRMWAMDPIPGLRLTLIDPNPIAPYTGMLPGHVAGHYRRDEIMIDLVRLARFAGARLILDRATGLDTTTRRIHLANRPPLRFDIASLDIGIGSGLPGLPGFAEHAAAAKPLGDYALRWETFLSTAPAEPALTLIGAGIGGVELALASAHRLRATGRTPRITLLERADTALPNIGPRARATLLSRLTAEGITLRSGTTATAIGPDHVTLSDGTRLPSDFTLSTAGTQPQGWLTQTGLSLQDGFLAVSPTLQTSDPAIFAAGDCAHLSHAPRPKAGVYAVRAAPILLHNLRALATGRPLRPYHPQRDYLKLVSLGGKEAVADKFGLRSGGRALWWLKDRIDRAFMAKFDAYPTPTRRLPNPAAIGLAEAMGDKPLCGGCGAKVGPGTLAASLVTLPGPARPDVITGAGDDAAILRHGTGAQIITTDHLRASLNDPRLMARITAIHAMGDIWAMGAAPQAALAQITLPRLAPALQSDMLAEIMEEAAALFTAEGAEIVGGHTSIGAELTIGFTLTGLTDHPVTKGGARPGDALLLTKSLGSGTLMAAEMALTRLPRDLLGPHVAAAWAAMSRPQGTAARLLAPYASAMTDITGFGLAGHLLEMMEASHTAATIDLAALPLLAGAEALAAQGIASSIAPANRAATAGRLTAPNTPRAALLFDPQTAGPLLAALPPDQANNALAALHAAGEPATIIGHVTDGPPYLTVG